MLDKPLQSVILSFVRLTIASTFNSTYSLLSPLNNLTLLFNPWSTGNLTLWCTEFSFSSKSSAIPSTVSEPPGRSQATPSASLSLQKAFSGSSTLAFVGSAFTWTRCTSAPSIPASSLSQHPDVVIRPQVNMVPPARLASPCPVRKIQSRHLTTNQTTTLPPATVNIPKFIHYQQLSPASIKHQTSSLLTTFPTLPSNTSSLHASTPWHY
mmetsp:Transcript_11577/g.25111  ORF Transcript_11577/g.25111 Transcript_11577/m.25111 type:complete len:210 (+) Transcript_11577:1751-2380(+)